MQVSYRQRRCVIRYKDTNLKAIHNRLRFADKSTAAVSSDTKIQIWKQFTTIFNRIWLTLCCVIRYKDTNLKAIHNRAKYGKRAKRAVSSDTKIQIWKQFTTSPLLCIAAAQLCHPIQRYKFESNSQRVSYSWLLTGGCVIRYKDTNLKAIHNAPCCKGRVDRLCHPIQRYKFESNSQL